MSGGDFDCCKRPVQRAASNSDARKRLAAPPVDTEQVLTNAQLDLACAEALRTVADELAERGEYAAAIHCNQKGQRILAAAHEAIDTELTRLGATP